MVVLAACSPLLLSLAPRAAALLLPEPVRASPTLYPPPEILRRGEWFEPLPTAAQRLRDRIWTEIKSA